MPAATAAQKQGAAHHDSAVLLINPVNQLGRARMKGRLAAVLCLVALLSGNNRGDASGSAKSEFHTFLLPVVEHIKKHYIDAISPDTLMQAGARGIFRVLDPASEFVINYDETDWHTNIQILHAIARQVDHNALYSVGPDTLIRAGIAGMMSVLDPDTIFLEKLNLDNFLISTRGKYGGLGFRIQVVHPDSAIAVWSLLHNETPAARSGVRSGDLITAIDDSATTHMTASDAASLMRGEENTPVTLTIERAGHTEPLKITVLREVIQIKPVPYFGLIGDSTGYIKLTSFQKNCSVDVEKALREVLAEGAQRLIFDLRGNGGGYLDEAVKIADLFLPKDRLVVFTAGRAFAKSTEYVTSRDAILKDEPLIILVNGSSASASEIVAGAVQDWDRGLILGGPTVGKGSVQQTIPIGGDKAELKLTMAAYFLPSGRSIDKRMRKDSTLVALADKVFHTKAAGRIARGAGGVKPDIPMQRRLQTPLFSQLAGWRTWDSKFFSFTRQYSVDHPEVTEDFVADKSTLREFKEFALAQEFEYVSDLENRLKGLGEGLEEEEALDDLKKPMRRFLEEIEEIEEGHWEDNEELLKWKLTYGILEKNFGIAYAQRYDCTVDPQIQRAHEILSSSEDYEWYFSQLEIGVADGDSSATSDSLTASQ